MGVKYLSGTSGNDVLSVTVLYVSPLSLREIFLKYQGTCLSIPHPPTTWPAGAQLTGLAQGQRYLYRIKPPQK